MSWKPRYKGYAVADKCWLPSGAEDSSAQRDTFPWRVVLGGYVCAVLRDSNGDDYLIKRASYV
jgi:hypothetical protein